MKASMLGLVVSTVAFGASTVYFWQQFATARTQGEQVAEANRELNARVAELEKGREELQNARVAPGTNPFIAGAIGPHAPATTNPAAASATIEAASGQEVAKGGGLVTFNRAPMPASMVKMMQKQMRAQNAKTYFDVQERLGLTQAESDKLVDLITEQQSAGFNRMRNPDDPNAVGNEWVRIEGQISELLGPSRAAQYDEYKKEMPARMEVAMLSQQFDGSDASLSDTQRSRLISAMSQERESVPMPNYSSAASHEEYTRSYDEWQTDYDRRMAERARSILSPEQLTVYNEYQQFQTEMRAQMAAQGRMPGGRTGARAMMVAPGMRMAPPAPAPAADPAN
jgi:hypothetical protein